MKKLFTLLLLCFTTFHVLANPLTVVGEGKSFELAKQNAFTKAIELYLGTVVVSEKELQNYELRKNEILVYSSGFVTDYKILSETILHNYVRLTMEITVSENKISNRILGKFNSINQVNSSKIKDTIDSFRQEKYNALNLVENILKDYPYKAFQVKSTQLVVKEKNSLELQLIVPYTLSWNYNYIVSLEDALKHVQDGTNNLFNKPNSTVTIEVKNPKDNIFGRSNTYNFNNLQIPNLLRNSFYDNELRILTRFNNKNNVTIWYVCHFPNFLSGKKPAFYGSGDIKNLRFHGNSIENGEVKLDVSPRLYQVLDQIVEVKLEIVRHNEC